MYTLYFTKGTCALASHIALEEAGAKYETRRIDFSKGEQQAAAYLAINPKARVPALVTPRGVLTETPAILAYIAQMFPGAALAPNADIFAFAEMQSFNNYLCSTVHVAFAHGRRANRWADDPAAIEDMKRKMPETFAACLDQIESTMLRGPWVMGDAYTVADGYLFTLFRWIEGAGLEADRFPILRDHSKRVLERPAVQRALAIEAA